MTLREPVSVLYGGAHLFKPDAATRLGAIAQRTLSHYAADPLLPRVQKKLATEPVEDLRIDFEDGYGVRADDEEDGHAKAAGHALASAGTPFIGIRVNNRRAARTLAIFLDAAGALPAAFSVTLPKVSSPRQVAHLVRLLDRTTAVIELMAETPEAILDMRELILAGEGRVRSIHFGAYDYLSSLDVPADVQHLLHPFCDDARMRLKLGVAGSNVRIADGATSVLPLGDDARAALTLHERHVTHALQFGIYQGWDLHPAQLVARYFALYRFFRGGAEKATTRLRKFVEDAARARATGGEFDDAATARGVALFFLRGHTTGALEQLPFAPEQLARYAAGDFSA